MTRYVRDARPMPMTSLLFRSGWLEIIMAAWLHTNVYQSTKRALLISRAHSFKCDDLSRMSPHFVVTAVSESCRIPDSLAY